MSTSSVAPRAAQRVAAIHRTYVLSVSTVLDWVRMPLSSEQSEHLQDDDDRADDVQDRFHK
jgi:hypothetical protein